MLIKKKELKEQLKHGDALFPLSAHETVADPSFYDAPLFYHWHPEMELFYVVVGQMKFQINEAVVDLCEGDIIIVKPNALHGSQDCYHEKLVFRAILVNYAFVAGITNDYVQQKYVNPLFSETDGNYFVMRKNSLYQQELFTLVNKISRIYSDQEDGMEIKIKSLLYEAFYYIHLVQEKFIKVNNPDTRKETAMKNIVQYINENYCYKITLEELAKEVSMSVGHLCRFFRENFRMTFLEYLLKIRMCEAERLLIETDHLIERIAMDTGFTNSNYFTISFKKSFKVTPSQYRKKCQDFNKTYEDK